MLSGAGTATACSVRLSTFGRTGRAYVEAAETSLLVQEEVMLRRKAGAAEVSPVWAGRACQQPPEGHRVNSDGCDCCAVSAKPGNEGVGGKPTKSGGEGSFRVKSILKGMLELHEAVKGLLQS